MTLNRILRPTLTTTLFILLGLNLFGQSILLNGSFKQGNLYWTHLAQNGSIANFLLSTGQTALDTALEVDLIQPGPNAWDAQSIHDGSAVVRGQQYKVSFWAKSNSPSMLRLVMQDTSYQATDYTIGSNWTRYEWLYAAPENGVSLKFHWLRAGHFFVSSVMIVPANLQTIPTYPDSLQFYANQLGLNIGAAINPELLTSEPAYKKLFTQQFNSLVAENVMKMATISTGKDQYDFFMADSLVRYARRTGKKMRGHTLLWYASIPNWLQNGNFPNDSLVAILKRYTFKVVGRYKNDINEWDVVNEALSDQSPNGLRNHFIYNALGFAIIDSMFKWTHQAAPSARLYYNDYNIEYNTTKTNALLSMLIGMKSRGIPIHGVGFQSHFDFNFNNGFLNAVNTTIGRVASLGLKVSFTEVDLAIRTPVVSNDYIVQGRNYAQLLRVVLNNQQTVTGFTLWGFTDKHSWIPSFWASMGTPKDDALILDRNYLPKPAYDSLLQVFRRHIIVGYQAEQPPMYFSVAPNPTSGLIVLKNLTLNTDVQITNLHGQLVNPIRMAPNTLDFSPLPSGLYFIKQGQRTIKILKE